MDRIPAEGVKASSRGQRPRLVGAKQIMTLKGVERSLTPFRVGLINLSYRGRCPRLLTLSPAGTQALRYSYRLLLKLRLTFQLYLSALEESLDHLADALLHLRADWSFTHETGQLM